MSSDDSQIMSSKDVARVAHLARLALTPEALEEYRVKLSAVLGYAQSLQQLDLNDVEPMTTPFDSFNRLADDQPEAGLSNQALMDMAPAKSEPFILVPKVLGDSGGA